MGPYTHCVHACMRTNVCVCGVHVCVHASVCLCVCVCGVHVCMHVSLCVCVFTCVQALDPWCSVAIPVTLGWTTSHRSEPVT